MPLPLTVYFLGTGGSTPFSLRRMPCIATKYENSLVIFDFGECCQYSLLEKKLHPFRSKTYILLTHFHADHVGGLITFLHTLGLGYGKERITIVGPPGLIQFVNNITNLFGISHVLEYLNLIEVHLENKLEAEIIRESNFSIIAFKTWHNVPSVGYIFKEKDIKKFDETKALQLGIPRSRIRRKLLQGKSVTLHGKIILPEDVIITIPGRKIAYTGDTAMIHEIPQTLYGTDLLIHEATYIGKYHKNLASERFHSTVEDACKLAMKVNAKILALVHISPRYAKQLDEIQAIIEQVIGKDSKIKVILPSDGDILDIPVSNLK